MNFNAPVQSGIHMVKEDGRFKISVSIRNLTDEDVHLSTSDSRLFKLSVKERTFSEEGTVHRWGPGSGALHAVTSRTLEAGGTATRHYTVPRERDVRQRIEGQVEDLDWYDEDDIDWMMESEGWMDPTDTGVVRIEVGLPAASNYYTTVTRQYDLRTQPNLALDDELPKASMDALESHI